MPYPEEIKQKAPLQPSTPPPPEPKALMPLTVEDAVGLPDDFAEPSAREEDRVSDQQRHHVAQETEALDVAQRFDGEVAHDRHREEHA